MNVYVVGTSLAPRVYYYTVWFGPVESTPRDLSTCIISLAPPPPPGKIQTCATLLPYTLLRRALSDVRKLRYVAFPENKSEIQNRDPKFHFTIHIKFLFSP